MELTHSNLLEASLLKTPKLDKTKLENAINNLIERYSYLQKHSSFENNITEQSQVNLINQSYLFETLDVGKKEAAELKTVVLNWSRKLAQKMIINTRAVLVAGVITCETEETDYLFIALHRMYVDRIAWRVLVSELYLLYDNKTLLSVTSSYQQWMAGLRSYSQHYIVIDKHLDYWITLEKKAKKFDPMNDKIMTEKSKELKSLFYLDMHNKSSAELENIILAATVSAIAKIYQISDIGLSLTWHGRDHLYKQIDAVRTVGYCQIEFPFVFNLDIGMLAEPEKMLEGISRQISILPQNGLSYAALAYFHPDIAVRSKLTPKELPAINFQYLGELDQLDPASNWKLDTLYPCWENGNTRRQYPFSITAFKHCGNLYIYIVCKDCDLDQEKLKTIFLSIERFLVTTNLENKEIRFSKANRKSFRRDFEPVITVGDESLNLPPCIMLHPGDGGAESYLNILHALSPLTRKMILFNNYIFHSGDLINLPQRFEDLADLYISFVDFTKFHDGIFLAGYSFGAILAYEMALQLEKAGVKLLGLYLIDPLFMSSVIDGEETSKNSLLPRSIDFFIAQYKIQDKERPKTPIHFFKAMIAGGGPNPESILEQTLERVAKQDFNGLIFKEADEIFVYPIHCNHYELLNHPYIHEIMNIILQKQV